MALKHIIKNNFKEKDPRQRAWLEIDSKAIESNVITLKKLIGDKCHLMAIVKADGYGHGVETVAKAAVLGGASYLGVASLHEGIQIRKLKIDCPVLILGNLTTVDDIDSCLYWNLLPTISSIDDAKTCQKIGSKYGLKFKIHLKIDTGMTRLGCDLKDAWHLFNSILQMKNVSLDGIYSHLAQADGDLEGESQKIFTSKQHEIFFDLYKKMSIASNKTCFHLANSAGTLRDKKLHYNMVRTGIALYGYSPIYNLKNKIRLKPAMSVKAKITFIRKVPPNVGVSYGNIYKTKKPSILAVVGIGYADGVSRSLSGKIFALFKGKYLPQIGAITMDQLVLDITDSPQLKVGDVVTLLGNDGTDFISAIHWSEMSGSIPWEVLCNFTHRLPRVII